jgi:hypothetical protein
MALKIDPFRRLKISRRDGMPSLSSSAPAHIPAISVVSFGEGLADPDLIRGPAIQTLSANSSDSPVWLASVITGTSPAHDTRWASSNTADDAAKLWDTCTGSAFLNWPD